MTRALIVAFLIFLSAGSYAQTADGSSSKVTVVTGARFAYKLVQEWIDDFNKEHPEIQIIIESRGSSDPAKYDILAEVYEQDQAIKQTREYLVVGRYAILPVAVAQSQFASVYGKKGLTKELIQQIYFHNIFQSKEDAAKIKVPYTVYTRMQKAGVPVVFANFFGFEQKDISGKGIAGSDEHLLKAMLRDSTGISYLPLPLIFDLESRQPVSGLAALPVDLNGNGKISDDEHFTTLDEILPKLEQNSPSKNSAVPFEYLHLSVARENTSHEAVTFLEWVRKNGDKYLADYGYLSPGNDKVNLAFRDFAAGLKQ